MGWVTRRAWEKEIGGTDEKRRKTWEARLQSSVRLARVLWLRGATGPSNSV